MRKVVWAGLGALCLSMMMSMTAYAGNINSAEQKALSEVAQPFNYKGETYRVTSEYIVKCQRELIKDEVNLSKGEVDNYVEQMRGSRKQLIEEGYCEKISDFSKEDTEQKEETENDNSENQTSAANREENNDDTEVEDETQNQNVAESTPVPDNEWDNQELGSALSFSSDDYTASKDGKVSLEQSGKQYQIQNRQKLREKNQRML